jgi:hypothetical protein
MEISISGELVEGDIDSFKAAVTHRDMKDTKGVWTKVSD